MCEFVFLLCVWFCFSSLYFCTEKLYHFGWFSLTQHISSRFTECVSHIAAHLLTLFLFFSYILLHRCLSCTRVYLLDLIQFQHPSARHLYSCFFFFLFFLIVLQLRVCFFFFCVNTTVCVFPMSLCVACFEDSQFSLTGGPVWLSPSSWKERITLSSLCVFHFIIVMQKIYYIRVVLFVVGFARVLAKVQNFKMKKEKHNIICVCEMFRFDFSGNSGRHKTGAGCAIFFRFHFSCSITDTLKETTFHGWGK